MGCHTLVVTVKSKSAKEKFVHAPKKDTRTEEFFLSIISQLIDFLQIMSEFNHPVERGQSPGDQVHFCCFIS